VSPRIALIALLLVAGCGFFREEAAEAEMETFLVSPKGDDRGDGTWEKPLATLQQAVLVARTTFSMRPKRIALHGGAYFVEQPVRLGVADSGLTIEPVRGEKVVLYGGRTITGWTHLDGHIWAADAPGVAEGDWDFRTLVVNGRTCPRSRLPETGTFEHESRFAVPWMSTTGGGWKRKPTRAELTTLKFREGDVGAWLETRNVEVTVYHMWDESMVGVASVDLKARILTFSNPAGHPPGAFGVRKYVLWNTRRGLTRPGQWQLDRVAGRVLYWPLPGEDMKVAEAIAPTTETILHIAGTPQRAVHRITVRGLALSVTDTPLVAGGFGAGKFDGAIQLLRTKGCRIEDVEIMNVGGQGIKEWGGSGLRVERCHVHHTGACGIKVGGGGNAVTDSHIHDVGIAYPSAIALWGSGTSQRGNRFAHNHVHHTPYTAINHGGSNHVIERNHIHDAMQTLHDGGAIYIGFGKNITLRGNFVHDIPDTGGYGSSAYYLDEQSEGCLVEGNLSLRVARPSHNHMARRNVIRNNVFVAEGDMRLTFPKCSDFTVERNVMAATGSITFSNPQAITSFGNNVIYSAAGRVVGKTLADYRELGAAALEPGEGSVLADPLVKGVEKGRVQFGRTSPARALGIAPVDVSDAGPR